MTKHSPTKEITMNTPTNPALRPLAEAKPGAGPLIFYTQDFYPQGRPLADGSTTFMGYVGNGPTPGVWVHGLGGQGEFWPDGQLILEGEVAVTLTHFAEPPSWSAPDLAFLTTPIGAKEIIDDLVGAVSSLDHQVEQMRGMFTDEDCTIADAVNAGDEATKRAELYLKGAPALTIYVSRTENDVDIWSTAPIPGLEIVTLNYDIDSLENYEAGDVTMVRMDETSDFEPCLVSKNVITGSGRAPIMRPATEDDMEA